MMFPEESFERFVEARKECASLTSERAVGRSLRYATQGIRRYLFDKTRVATKLRNDPQRQ